MFLKTLKTQGNAHKMMLKFNTLNRIIPFCKENIYHIFYKHYKCNIYFYMYNICIINANVLHYKCNKWWQIQLNIQQIFTLLFRV